MRIAIAVCLLVAGCISEPGLFIDKTGSGDGRVLSEPAGIDCGEQCGVLVTEPLTLTAEPDANSEFIGWSGSCTGTEPCVIDPADDVKVEAMFARKQYTLAFTPNEHAYIHSYDIDCGAFCDTEIDSGMTVRATVDPAEGYDFMRWSDGVTENPRLITVTENVQLAALVGQYDYLSVLRTGMAGGAGLITSSPEGIYCSYTCFARFFRGSTVTLTVTAGAEKFTGWDNCPQPQGTSCVVEVAGALQVSANFEYTP